MSAVDRSPTSVKPLPMSAPDPEANFDAGQPAYPATERAGKPCKSGSASCRQLARRRQAGAAKFAALMTRSDKMILNPDHVTIAVADAGPAIEFFALLGFRKHHAATIDGGVPARYMGMPAMIAQHITLALEGTAHPFELQLLQFAPPPGTDPRAHP